MAQLNWSPRARQDLADICEFVSRDSEKFAATIAQQIFRIVERLPDQPFAGGIVPEYDRTEIRERFLYNYRIIYRISGEAIEVVTIVHGARLLPSDLTG